LQLTLFRYYVIKAHHSVRSVIARWTLLQLKLFPYCVDKGPSQSRVDLLLCCCSGGTGLPEEGRDDNDDVVPPRNLASKHMSASFSCTEEGLHNIAVFSCRFHSQVQAAVYSRGHTVCTVMQVVG
jgi:hypothetical protein